LGDEVIGGEGEEAGQLLDGELVGAGFAAGWFGVGAGGFAAHFAQVGEESSALEVLGGW